MQYYVFMQFFSFQLTFYWKWPILTPPFDPRELENGVRLPGERHSGKRDSGKESVCLSKTAEKLTSLKLSTRFWF